MTGAMPVTRIVPASPMTKAPHQLVSFFRPRLDVPQILRSRGLLGVSAHDSPFVFGGRPPLPVSVPAATLIFLICRPYLPQAGAAACFMSRNSF